MNVSPINHAITSMLAVRSWRGGLARVMIFLLLIYVVAECAGWLLSGKILANPAYTFSQVILTAMPFMALVFYAVTCLDKAHSALFRAATEDMLTSLNNRSTFFSATRNAHSDAGFGVLMMLDADFFKRVNDQFGHAAGDQTLRAIARRIRSMMREEDIVGRLGGEEFAIYLPGATFKEALPVARRLAGGVDVPLDDAGALLAVTLSVGAVEMSEETTLEIALNRADQALYLAKANGRARAEIWQDTDEAA